MRRLARTTVCACVMTAISALAQAARTSVRAGNAPSRSTPRLLPCRDHAFLQDDVAVEPPLARRDDGEALAGAFIERESLERGSLNFAPSRLAMIERNSSKIGCSASCAPTTSIRQQASGTNSSSGMTLSTASSARRRARFHRAARPAALRIGRDNWRRRSRSRRRAPSRAAPEADPASAADRDSSACAFPRSSVGVSRD